MGCGGGGGGGGDCFAKVRGRQRTAIMAAVWRRRCLRLALVSMACKFLTSYMHERVIGMKRCASPRPPSLPIQRLQAQSDATALCATNNDGHCFSAAFSDSLAKCERGRGGRVALLPLCSWLVGAS